MLIINVLNPGLAAAFTIMAAFMAENIVLLGIIGGILLLLVYVLYRLRIKNKKRHEVVHPVTEILGNVPERVREMNEEIKPLGFAYEPYQDIFFSLLNPWQRKLGYCRLYDEASAALSMIIDCEPITFEYAGRKWLIEFWKGQYGMNTGGEVGIYYTADNTNLDIPGLFTGTFYYCPKDDECIDMSFTCRKKGNLLFTRSGYHWWLTGFKLGEFSKPSDLSMDITLDLYDKKMAHAFTEALIRAGYKEDQYRLLGRRVMVRYDKPHTKQPLTRTAFTDFIMQRNNESFCNAYNYLTSEYKDTLDKLVILRNENPGLYNRIMLIGKPKEAFDAYGTLQQYLKDKD